MQFVQNAIAWWFVAAVAAGHAVLAVWPERPTVTSQPSPQTASAGASASFSASAEGSPTPSVQWQVSMDGGATFQPIAAATATTLTLDNLSAEQHGNLYAALFTNGGGSVRSDSAELDVRSSTWKPSPPAILKNPLDQVVSHGGAAAFTASACADPPAVVEWHHKPVGAASFRPVNDHAASTTLTLERVADADGGEYKAIFTNIAGSASTRPARLTINPAKPPDPKLFVIEHPKDQVVIAGKQLNLTAAAGGDANPKVQWYASLNGGNDYVKVDFAAGPTLTVEMVDKKLDGARYKAVFTSQSGRTVETNSAAVTVHWGPEVEIQPKDVAVEAGKPAKLTAAARGKPEPKVQWEESRDGGTTYEPIKGNGAKRSTLELGNIGPDEHDRKYRAVFSNEAGEKRTEPATVAVQKLKGDILVVVIDTKLFRDLRADWLKHLEKVREDYRGRLLGDDIFLLDADAERGEAQRIADVGWMKRKPFENGDYTNAFQKAFAFEKKMQAVAEKPLTAFLIWSSDVNPDQEPVPRRVELEGRPGEKDLLIWHGSTSKSERINKLWKDNLVRWERDSLDSLPNTFDFHAPKKPR